MNRREIMKMISGLPLVGTFVGASVVSGAATSSALPSTFIGEESIPKKPNPMTFSHFLKVKKHLDQYYRDEYKNFENYSEFDYFKSVSPAWRRLMKREKYVNRRMERYEAQLLKKSAFNILGKKLEDLGIDDDSLYRL